MPNPEHLARLKEGVEAWNQWRGSSIEPDLGEADLSGADLREADLSGANLVATNLRGVNLSGSNLSEANLSVSSLGGADLSKANLLRADLSGADLPEANLRQASISWAHLHRAHLSGAILTRANLVRADLGEADLTGAILVGANLSEADLSGANLNRASLVGADFEDANLTGCSVYGISVWNARLDGAKQSNLLITPAEEPAIRVDSLEVAQFIYLLLNNAKIRHVIDTITSKVVLILGRFTPERKVVLDTIREELRKRDYVPILFDFEKPTSKDLTGTISTLANMARFIIADLTDPSSVPHELATLAPTIVVPIQTLLLKGQREYAMFRDLVGRHHWVLEPYHYKSLEQLLDQLSARVIGPAEAKAKELRLK